MSSVPNGSRCAIGFRLRRPMSRAVSSPRRVAAYACMNSWTVIPRTIAITNATKPTGSSAARWTGETSPPLNQAKRRSRRPITRSGFIDPGPDPRSPRAITCDRVYVRSRIPDTITEGGSAIGAWGRPMGQAVWTGNISFGLVRIPVKLYPATEPKDVRFHLYDRRTGKRVRYERVTRYDEPATFEAEPSLDDSEPDDRVEPRVAGDIERELAGRSRTRRVSRLKTW